MRQLVLVGLMGSGKSTVGALVANRTGGRLVDVDVVIAEETGKTVRELWEEGGEDAYRGLESGAVLRTLADDTPSVLAAPGGVVLDPAVRAALAGHIVVWLRTSPAALASRVHVGDHRPLLGDQPAKTFAAMADQRSDLYCQVATATIDTDGRSPDGVCRQRRRAAGRHLTRTERRHDASTTGPHDTPRPSGSTASGASSSTQKGPSGRKAGGGDPSPDATLMRTRPLRLT